MLAAATELLALLQISTPEELQARVLSNHQGWTLTAQELKEAEDTIHELRHKVALVTREGERERSDLKKEAEQLRAQLEKLHAYAKAMMRSYHGSPMAKATETTLTK